MKTIFNFIFAMIVAFGVGGAMSVGLNINPALAIGGAVTASVVGSFLPKQSGIMSVVLLKEAFHAELIQSLYKKIDGSFLEGIQNLSSLVDNDKIKWNKIGVPPGVTIGAVTFPRPVQSRVDGSDDIYLQEMRTDVTKIHEDELHALPYDKKSTVFKQHKEELIESFYKWTLHALCPPVDTTDTPVLETTGADDGSGRLKLTVEDVIKLRTSLDKIGVGNAKLILTPDHIGDLRSIDPNFATLYHDIKTGTVSNMYGFQIYQHTGYAPVFDTTTLTKNAYGAAPASTDRQASVVIYTKNCFKALGAITVYYDEPEPTMEEHRISEKAYFTSGHFDGLKGNAALIDGRV